MDRDNQKSMLMAIFFIVVGLLLAVTGCVSLLLRIIGVVQSMAIWLVQQLRAPLRKKRVIHDLSRQV